MLPRNEQTGQRRLEDSQRGLTINDESMPALRLRAAVLCQPALFRLRPSVPRPRVSRSSAFRVRSPSRDCPVSTTFFCPSVRPSSPLNHKFFSQSRQDVAPTACSSEKRNRVSNQRHRRKMRRTWKIPLASVAWLVGSLSLSGGLSAFLVLAITTARGKHRCRKSGGKTPREETHSSAELSLDTSTKHLDIQPTWFRDLSSQKGPRDCLLVARDEVAHQLSWV